MTTASRYGRLSFPGKLGLYFLLALVLLSSPLLYIQTRHGFRHIVVPLAANLTGARLEVQDGWLSLLGALELHGLVYEDSLSGISFDAGLVALHATPWSFIEEGVPRIDELELKLAHLRIVHRGEATGGGPLRVRETEPTATLRLMPVAIEQARFEDVTVTVDQGDDRITGRATASIDRLGPGRTGNISMRSDFLLERQGTAELSGALDLKLALDVGSGGTPIKWSGSNQAILRTGRGTLDSADPDVLTFEQTFTGEYDHGAQNLRVASNVAIRRVGGQLGTAELTAAMDQAKHPAVTEASLTMAGITGDTLNLWLGKTAAARVQAGRFDARLEAHVEGTKTSVRGNATGSGVRLRSSDGEVSPPVDVSLKHGGSFDSATRDVAIDRLSLTIGDKVQTLLSGSLDRPVSLHLDRPGGKMSSAAVGVEPAVWSLRLGPSEIRELRPWLVLLGRAPLQEVVAGRLGGALVVSMQEDGAIIDVAGQLEGTDVMVRGEGSGQGGLTGPLKVVADWKSRLDGLQLFKLDPFTASVSLKGKQVATLRATGTWRFVDSVALTALNGTVTLSGLRGETLNPLLGMRSQVRISRAGIVGHADVAVDENRVRWDLDISGQDIQLRLPDATSDAPPLDLLIKQAGEFDLKARTLRLNQLGLQVVERRRPVVTLSLDHPLTLHLAQGKGEEQSQTGGVSETITLGLRVDRLGVQQLRPWVALAGSQALGAIQGGAVDADLKVRASGTDHVSVAGRVDLNEITFVRGGMNASSPVTLGSEVRASFVGRSRVLVESWAVRALDGNAVLAQARLTGSADPAGAADLVLDLTAGNVSGFVARLGLLTERQQELISGGTFKGNVRLATVGSAKPLTVKADLRSANVNLRLDKSHQLTRTIALQADVEVDASRTMATLQRVAVDVESGGSKAGILTANGRWPLSAADARSPAGTVNVTVKEWDSGPFVDFFGILPGRRSGPLPFTGELKLTQEAGGKSLGLQGKETIGPVAVAGKSGDPQPATVHVEHDIVRSGDAITVALLSLTAERSKGRADRLTLNGNMRMDPRPRLQLHGSVDAFDADWYAALVSPPSDHATTGNSSDRAHDAKEEGSSLAVPLDLDVDLAIGSVTYRTLEIGKGRLVAKGDGDRMQATLEPTGLAGGSVQGILTTALKGGQPEFGWNAKGNSLNLGVLTKAAFAEPDPRVTGRGGFTTSGTGRGQGEGLRQSLAGTVAFDVTDGQFVKSRVLDFLAEQTHVEEFRGLGFRTLHGEIQLKDGWAYLNQVRANGAAIAIEAGGKIGLDGRLDAQVQPKIGPALSSRVKIPCMNQFSKTADGFMVLPVAVTVKGTSENPAYGVQVTAGSMVGQQAEALVGTIANLLTGCRGGDAAQKATEDAAGAIENTAKDLLKDLLGGKRKR